MHSTSLLATLLTLGTSTLGCAAEDDLLDPELLDEDEDSEDPGLDPRGVGALNGNGTGVPGVVMDGTQWLTDDLVVCWVDPHYGHAPYRAWVRGAVERTWQAVTRLRFSGWGDCDDTEDPDITIAVADVNPNSLVGRESLDHAPSMWLNFEYDSFAHDRCDHDTVSPNGKSVRRNCIEKNAMHEFGHAIGLKHEQNHHDSACAENADDEGLSIYDYDPESTMNYCNSELWQDPYISDGDIRAAATMYPSAVMLYRNADFGGARQIVGPGTYRGGAGDLATVGNDLTSSIVIPPGYLVTVCPHETPTKTCATYGSSRRTLPSALDNQISYVHVRPVAHVYRDPGLRGPAQTFLAGKHLASAGQLGNLGNEQASSLFVPHTLRARLCEHEGGGAGSGVCDTFTGGKPYDETLDIDIADDLDDRTSFVQVTALAVAYVDADLRGDGITLPVGIHRASQNPDFPDDQISSIAVGPGLEAIACESEGSGPFPMGGGLCRTFTKSASFVGTDLDGRISFIEVRYPLVNAPPG